MNWILNPWKSKNGHELENFSKSPPHSWSEKIEKNLKMSRNFSTTWFLEEFSSPISERKFRLEMGRKSTWYESRIEMMSSQESLVISIRKKVWLLTNFMMPQLTFNHWFHFMQFLIGNLQRNRFFNISRASWGGTTTDDQSSPVGPKSSKLRTSKTSPTEPRIQRHWWNSILRGKRPSIRFYCTTLSMIPGYVHRDAVILVISRLSYM